MTFDLGGPDGVVLGYSQEKHTALYSTAREVVVVGGGGDGNGGEFFLSGKGDGEVRIDVRGAEEGIVEFEDVVLLSSSFTSSKELGSDFYSSEFMDWLEMDPVSKSTDNEWIISCGTHVAGSTSASYVESNGGPLGDAEIQRLYPELDPSYVADSSEGRIVDKSVNRPLDGNGDYENDSGMSIGGYEDCSSFLLDYNGVSNSSFDDPDGIFCNTTFCDFDKMEGTSWIKSLNETPQMLSKHNNVTDMTYGNYSHSSVVGKSLGKRIFSEDDRKVFGAISKGDQTISLDSRSDWATYMDENKVCRETMPSKSRKVEKNAPDYHEASIMCPEETGQIQENDNLPHVLRPCPSPIRYQNRLIEDSYNLSNQCEPVVPAKQQSRTIQSNGYAPGRPQHLNPKEKIEKLKRRQQMQAKLAIQMQQQQFHEQMNCTHGFHSNNLTADKRNITLSAEHKISVESNFPDISAAGDGSSLTETTVSQLGDAISKLDDKLKICFRDSLFRLARSASERAGAEERSSINSNNSVASAANGSYLRLFESTNSELETNQIDRIVAFLLFNKHPRTISNTVSEEPSCHKAIKNGIGS